MGKWKITHKGRSKDQQKYYKSIAASIGKILKSSDNQEFRKQCQSILGITHITEAEERLVQLMTQNK